MAASPCKRRSSLRVRALGPTDRRGRDVDAMICSDLLLHAVMVCAMACARSIHLVRDAAHLALFACDVYTRLVGCWLLRSRHPPNVRSTVQASLPRSMYTFGSLNWLNRMARPRGACLLLSHPRQIFRSLVLTKLVEKRRKEQYGWRGAERVATQLDLSSYKESSLRYRSLRYEVANRQGFKPFLSSRE